MKEIKRQKKQLDAYQEYKLKLFWKKFGKVCLKVLFITGLIMFFMLFFFFYFAKICINNK